MKKSLFLLFASFSIAAANAQIKNDKGTFTKPSAGEYAIETQATPNVTGGGWFLLNPVALPGLSTLNVVPGGIIAPAGVLGGTVKVRKFKSDKLAERATLNLSVGNASQKNQPGAAGLITTSQTAIGLVASYGKEKHFVGAERLSTYIGWDAMIGVYNISNNNGASISQTNFGVGGQVVSGIDYYVLPKVYLGLELNYGLGIVSRGTTALPAPGGSVGGGSNISLNPNLGGIFRLGYRL
ncbi:MAG: hypothetical protein KGP35_06165 [Bacteroidetes bacterium]|nr:hypothetical protein [Bacteroidota bacterium]